MRQRRLFSAPRKVDEEINISPLIDIVFILLIFFIVSTVFDEQESMDIDEPTAQMSSPNPDEAVYVDVTADGRIGLGGKYVAVGSVSPMIKRLNPQMRPVVVRADKKITAERLINVVDQIKQAGVSSVNVSTQSP